MDTLSHIARPADSRCKWWQRIATEAEVLGTDPAQIDGASTLPGAYQRKAADTELPAWTVVLDGQENHHVKARGWRHLLGIVVRSGDRLGMVWITTPMQTKALIKAAAPHLAGGSGPNAALLRAARYVLEGQGDGYRIGRAGQLWTLGAHSAPDWWKAVTEVIDPLEARYGTIAG